MDLSLQIIRFIFIFLFSNMPFIWGINTSIKLSSYNLRGNIFSNYLGITVPFLGFGLGLNISFFLAEIFLTGLLSITDFLNQFYYGIHCSTFYLGRDNLLILFKFENKEADKLSYKDNSWTWLEKLVFNNRSFLIREILETKD